MKPTAFLLTSLLLALGASAQGATVEFPSPTQPGKASLALQENQWVLSNTLFSASYVLQDGKLLFGGSAEMNLAAGTELFEIVLGDGRVLKASEMKLLSSPSGTGVAAVDLKGDPKAVRYSERLDGKALTAVFTADPLKVEWRAVLRDGSHYLRTEMQLSTTEDIPMRSIHPMFYRVLNQGHAAPKVVGNTRGAPMASDRLFAGLENPLAHNQLTGSASVEFEPTSWEPKSWTAATDTVPAGVLALGFTQPDILVAQGKVSVSAAGEWSLDFQYTSGRHRLNITGVDLVKDSAVVASDYHSGFAGRAASENTYRLKVPEAGEYILRYFVEKRTEPATSTGKIAITPPTEGAAITMLATPADSETLMSSWWSRKTTLQAHDVWRIASVVGILAEGQARRSFLAYHERERAVPWRSFIHYNSWYELGIGRNSQPDPLKRMVESQCLEVVSAWKKQLYDRHGVGIDAFVWDDGWDDFNSLWDFHAGFPNGFKAVDALAGQMGAGTGVWLGPVGGYGRSKAQRIAYWNENHTPHVRNFQLSNKVYFDAFVGRCARMVEDYDLRYFKFDGISTQFSAVGPSNEEDAEGILKVMHAVRQQRPDLFINTTVGSWASPFWFQHTDSIWRQEHDYHTIGDQGDVREKWITYRDRLVHQNFVMRSPLCPINTLMTHGVTVTKHGGARSAPRDNSPATVQGIIREIRSTFAAGAMVELYVDHDLMTSIGDGVLWKELADCIKWHRAHSDLLADIHWVGGNPWDGEKASIYGWAAWNPRKSMLTLRNPSASAEAFTTTLREALDIPSYVKGSIKLQDAFGGQHTYAGITGETVDIDKPITFNMPPFDVVVLDGVPKE